MIEILNDNQTHYIQKCENCGCIFTYEDDDIRHGYSEVAAWCGVDGHFSVIKCPKCGQEIEL